MSFETIFIGNESPYLETLNKLSNLSNVVCEPIRGTAQKFFGSAHRFAEEKKILLNFVCEISFSKSLVIEKSILPIKLTHKLFSC